MKILGIETSCDETGAAIVEDGTKILSNVVASSQELHIKTGGIIPETAAREQIKCIIPVIEEAIENCKLKIENLDAIAVTIGPGLIGSLLVGVETAKTLAYLWQKHIIPVNHLLAHVYANWLIPENSENSDRQKIRQSDYLKIRDSDIPSVPSFPNIALIASGGHTELVLMKSHGKYICLGGTRDDAAGECFDKCARLLGLGYPGGPAIAAAAAKYQVLSIKYKVILPRPMINSDDFDFSFSGLKTAVIRELHKLRDLYYNNIYYHSEPRCFLLPTELKSLFADEIQEAITDVLVEKIIRAAEKYRVKSILLAGGVAANQRLRQKFQAAMEQWNNKTMKLFIPPPSLCTDNAAIIASYAYFNFKTASYQKIQALPSLGL
ncbi:tRNA (adenosine(37)-N6)-threonylcarbamoyltransferase complex transferase subunit TsaD [Candidatus Gottesmanbacteria bacterium]|nr:tRNA (adenosine(37)-N6)-threonylcarbamoyltransferase complex transferase subunit TsaD [Candidatus Gottesmanbacteria bacterium]